MAVNFYFEKPVNLRERTGLKQFIKKIFKSEKTQLNSLDYIFCSDTSLLKINQNYLKHNYYTDIITFNLGNPNDKLITAEIYISVDRVKENAKSLGNSINQELHRVIFHGVLHLCGYDDKTKSQSAEMRKKEEALLKKYGLL